MSEVKELPKGWEIRKLGEICERVTKGGTPTTYGFSFVSKGVNFIKVENIENGKVIHSSIVNFITEEAHQYQKKSILQENDLLFSIAGTIGETCLIKKEYLPANTNQALAILRGYHNEITPGFLTFQLNSSIQQYIRLKARGGAMNNISLEDLKGIEIILPPFSTQATIVSKIEELFSELDKGIESLRTAQQQLRTYRQSVLKWAFEGRLTRDDVKDGELPEGWTMQTLKELKLFSIYGPRFSSGGYVENGVAVLRTTDIDDRGKVDWENSPKLDLSDKDYEKYKLIKNDLLITRTGSIGRLSVFNDDKKAIPGAFLIHYRLRDDVNVWYVFNFLQSQAGQKHLKAHSFGVGRPNLNVPNIELLQIPIPSPTEQNKILEEIESRFSVVEKMEESISQSLLQAEALRQSILKMAFEGRLVK